MTGARPNRRAIAPCESLRLAGLNRQLLGAHNVDQGQSWTCEGTSSPHFLDSKIAADLPSQELVDFTMARNSRSLVVFGIVVDGMSAAFTKQPTTLRFQMTDEVLPFHDPVSEKRSLEIS